jgi:alpha-beta hydrolase superfamily lysophospholipase
MQNSSNAKEHADYVWKHYVKEVTPKHIAVIAHSYGGFLAVDLVSQCTPIPPFFVVGAW